MYRFVVLVLCVLALVEAHPRKASMPPCARLVLGGLECCQKETPIMKPHDDEDMEECFQLLKKSSSCDFEICKAKKKGYASDDGTIDMEKYMQYVENQNANFPALVNNLKDNCIIGDVSKYGPADFCDLLKRHHCFQVEIVKSCEEWNDEGSCSGIKDIAAECVKQFS